MHRTEFLEFKLLHCDDCMWLLPHCHPFSSEIHPVTFYRESSRRFSSNIPPSFWPTYQTLQSYTERKSWKPAHVQAHKEGNFCLAVTGNSSLGSRSGVGGVGEKILHCMGMGLKENTAQTPDVETPCTHTSTHTNKCKHTQWHTYTKTNRWGKEAVMRVINQLLELHLASSDWSLELISWVCWQSLKWANTRCQDEQMRRCVCPWVSTRANETR